MENLNFHKQKLYSLIVAGVGLISILLTWGSYGPVGWNGLRGFGFVALIGVGIVAAACFMGDKTRPFEGNSRNMALGGFGAMVAGAILFMLINLRGEGAYGYVVKPKPGLGLFLCAIAGIAGILWVLGKIKLPENKKPPVA